MRKRCSIQQGEKDNCWSEQSPEKSTVSTVPFFFGHPVYGTITCAYMYNVWLTKDACLFTSCTCYWIFSTWVCLNSNVKLMICIHVTYMYNGILCVLTPSPHSYSHTHTHTHTHTPHTHSCAHTHRHTDTLTHTHIHTHTHTHTHMLHVRVYSHYCQPNCIN